MKLIISLIMFLTVSAFAVDFVIPEVQAKFDALDASVASNLSTSGTNSASITTLNSYMTQTADGLLARRVARATWDFSTDGGAAAAYDLGVNLPANSIINHAYIYVAEQVVDGGAGTGALHCEDANNLYSAADVSGSAAGSFIDGIPDNTAANMVAGIASECALTWTIAGSAATAGKLLFFVEYAVAE